MSEGLGLTASTQHRLLRTKGLRSLAVPGKAALSVRVDDLVKREVCLGVVPKRRKHVVARPASWRRNEKAGIALNLGVTLCIKRDWISRA